MMNNTLWRKKLTLILLTCLITVLLSGSILEGILRTGIVNNPHYDRLRIHGKQTHAKYRLLVLGDSFIVVNSLLGRALAQDLGPYNVAVLNVAISGTGPFEYLTAMQTFGVQFHPHIVLLSYYVGNDLTNVQNNTQFNPTGRGDKSTGVSINSSASLPYFRELYSYQYLLSKIQLARTWLFDYQEMKAAGIPSEFVEDARNLKINPWLLQLALHQKNYLLDNILMETPENRRAWEKVKDLLAEIHDACKRHNAQLVMVIFPHSLQVNDSHFEFFRRLTFKIDERTLESVKPQKLLMEFCAARRIACLDLLPGFKVRQDELYRENDDHLNDRGNHLAKEVILHFLLKNTSFASSANSSAGSKEFQ